MPTLQELMGQEVYNLLYTHYDSTGNLIEDMEDVFYCDDDEISQDRIFKLEALLTPITDAKSSLIPLEAANLLAAWGVEKAIDYFEYCLDKRIDRLGNLDPHRLHATYDTTYEKVIESCIRYQTRYAERDYIEFKTHSGALGKVARSRIVSPIKKAMLLSKELVLDMGYLISVCKSDGWQEYLPILKECYLDFIQRPENDLNRKWNLPALTELLQEWEPEFLEK